MSLGTVFISELAGTAILVLFGCGVVANVALNKTKGLNGGFLGGVLAWAAYKKHFDDTTEPEPLLDVFSTGPAIRSPLWNTVTEVIGTFVLVFVILTFAGTPSGLGPLAAAPLVLGIGNSLGGPAGYAINPARDLGPRIAHAVLPIPHKGGNDWHSHRSRW